MEGGRLGRRVALERPQEGRDSTGDTTVVWQPVATVWARVETLSGRELSSLHEVHAEASVRVTLRYRDDVAPTWRLVDGGRVFSVESVVPDEKRSKLTLVCKEELS